MEFPKESVILVHGLWLTGIATFYWKVRLQKAGFHVVVFSYASTRNTLSENAIQLSNFITSIAAFKIHLVGHSLGGLLILKALNEHFDARIKRVVLVGTPYTGNKVATRLAKSKWGSYLLGRSMGEWLNLKLADIQKVEVGGIAGSLPIGLGRLICNLPLPHDGTVSVEETKVPNMKDHVLVRTSHTSMLLSKAVTKQIVSFLKYGRFIHGD